MNIQHPVAKSKIKIKYKKRHLLSTDFTANLDATDKFTAVQMYLLDGIIAQRQG